MQKDLISVVVPCYNMSHYLKDCFESLDNQTYKNFEVIFVNDGSTDDTLQLLKQYCKNKTNCQLVDQQNAGLSGARNSGLKLATGEYVYFYDPDDFLSPQLLFVLHKNLVEYNADISIVRYKRVKENFRLNYSKLEKLSQKFQVFDQEDTISQLYSGMLFDVCVWNKLYKHSILKQIETYPDVFNTKIRYGEDVEFNFRYLTNCHKCIFNYTRLYYYRQRKSSLVHSGFKENRLTDFIGINYVERGCRNTFPEAEQYIKSWKALVCIEMLWYILLSDYDNKENINKLFFTLKNYIKYVPLGKRNNKLLRVVVPGAYPLLKLSLAKRLYTKA